VLHEALKRRSYWRPAIDALQSQPDLVDDAEGARGLDKLVAEHGFPHRRVQGRADAPAAPVHPVLRAPGAGQVDWSQYFKVDGKDPQAVTAEARQICLDGLAHGRRYEVQVREACPRRSRREAAQDGGACRLREGSRAVRARLGARLRAAQPWPAGHPARHRQHRQGQREVYRIGDRSLAQTLQSGDFAKRISSYDINALKERTGAQVYAGELSVATRLNEDVTTAFPIAEAIPKLQPGVYVLAAYASTKKEDDSYRSRHTVVRRFRSRSHRHQRRRRHAHLRALACRRHAGGQRQCAPDRPQQLRCSGTAKTDSRGYARFDARLTRGEGGLAPAVLVPRRATGDYCLPRSGDRGLRPHRPRRQGPQRARARSTAFAYTDRGV
jgi:hypothetical protein